MRHANRKSTPKVRNGRVQRKNRTTLSPDFRNYPQGSLTIDRQRPGDGCRHLLHKADIERFIEIIPDWSELSTGLEAIVLAPGTDDCMGWHTTGIVAVCAWERDVAGHWYNVFVDEHRDVLERLNVRVERADADTYWVDWDEPSAAAFQLMHVFLHELGHHHDRITTQSQKRAARGEPYAERYAIELSDQLWENYFRVFG